MTEETLETDTGPVGEPVVVPAAALEVPLPRQIGLTVRRQSSRVVLVFTENINSFSLDADQADGVAQQLRAAAADVRYRNR